jgi:hypothetical protein
MESTKLDSEDSKSTIYGDVGFAIFIILFGLAYLLPSQYAPDGSLFLAAGAIILTVSLIKWFKKLDLDGFDIALGAIFLVNGINKVFQLGLGILPVLMVVFGVIYLASVIRSHLSS